MNEPKNDTPQIQVEVNSSQKFLLNFSNTEQKRNKKDKKYK